MSETIPFVGYDTARGAVLGYLDRNNSEFILRVERGEEATIEATLDLEEAFHFEAILYHLLKPEEPKEIRQQELPEVHREETEFEKSIREQVGNSWAPHLIGEFEKPYMTNLMQQLAKERQMFDIYPSSENVMRAFRETPFDEVKIVILGQDPYHTPEMAHGLAFSVPNDTLRVPPSLQNIFKELESDIAIPRDFVHNPDLTRWARQGVLLLNTTLTVRKGLAGSHSNLGWRTFTEYAIKILGQRKDKHLVFILWGNHACEFADLIDESQHEIIRSSHPSPLSAHNSFFGSKPFSRANNCLKEWGEEPVDWLGESEVPW